MLVSLPFGQGIKEFKQATVNTSEEINAKQDISSNDMKGKNYGFTHSLYSGDSRHGLLDFRMVPLAHLSGCGPIF